MFMVLPMKAKSGAEAALAAIGAVGGMYANGYIPKDTTWEIVEGVLGLAAVAVGFYFDGYVGDFVEGLGVGLLVAEGLTFTKK